MPDDLTRPQVLVSYNPETREHVQFALGLAERLDRAGFKVLLDGDNQVPEPVVDNESQATASNPRHSVFIVTRAWLERAGSKPEINPTAGQSTQTHRYIAVRRESVDERLLAARLPGLPSVEWLPDDPEPDARFWEVFCGLTQTHAGDRREWAEYGRSLLEGRMPGLPDPDDSREPDTTALPNCPSRPVLAIPAQDWIFLLTDSGACFSLSRGKPLSLKPLPDLDGCSALAVDGAGRLHAGLYDGMIAVPRNDEWAYHPADAAVLSLAATPWGLAIGDASGSVTYRNPPEPPSAKVALGEAVVDLAAMDEGVVALGARGGLWRIGKPQGGTIAPGVISMNEALGRPVGLFDTGNPSKVGVFSVERLALLNHGARHLTVGIRRFPDGIDKVTRFGPRPGKTEAPPFGVLTDAGQVWFVDADLKTVAAVLLPDESREVVGLAPGPFGWLLAWTTNGNLLAVSRDRMVRTLATGAVTLAFADPDLPVRVTVVHWHPDHGVQVRRLRPEPTR